MREMNWRAAERWSRLACLLVTLGGCAVFASPRPPAGAAPTADATAPYVIGPGDQLSVFVYEQPSLSTGDVPVRPDGRISIPLAEDVTAAGKTPSELSAALVERLKKYVRDPNVTVMVHGFVGPFDHQIRVIGEAADPQASPYRAHMTLLDVMIETKGLTRFAAGNSAMLIRRGPNGPEKLHVRLSDLIKDGDISQNIEMQPGDTLIIPQSWF
jgi:polysaccharide export outer membrane protein